MLQPAILSRGAVAVLASAVVDGAALTRTCGAYHLTHDLALGLLAWMYGLHWHVKGSHGSVNHEMAGGFNVQPEHHTRTRLCRALTCRPVPFLLVLLSPLLRELPVHHAP
jgi:hypothetical protein